MADPIHIQAPDGSVVEFPAGTSDSVITSVMAKNFGGPKQSSEGQQSGVLQSLREAIHAPTRALENGIFMGLGDRARAGIGALIGDGSYGSNLADEQKQSEQFKADHPIVAPVLEGVGSAAAPLSAVGAASKATSLGGKFLAGAGTGGAIGGVQGALSSKDYTDVPQTAKDAATGAIIGGGIGGSIPVAGRAIGAGAQALANTLIGKPQGISRGASRHLIDALSADTPSAVQSQIQRLGPDAMLADAGPAFLGKAQGASLNSDEGRSALVNALTQRNEGTNARIMGDVNRALGPAEDPQTVTNAIRAHRSAVDNQNYPAALDNGPPVDTSGVLANLGPMIGQSVGMENRALQNLRGMLMTEQNGQLVPVTDPRILHRIKGELDNVIEYDAPGLGVPAAAVQRQQGALRQMRGQINEALEQQVPGYAEANRQSAGLARRGEAVEQGTQYLGSGKTTPSPDRFADEFAAREPGEQIAFAKGSRGNIDRVLGTKANDLQALRQELQGEGGWNTAKLATVHGQDAADQLVGSVDRNLKFRDTYNKVVENSQTAQRQAAADAMKPNPPSEIPIINPNMSYGGAFLSGLKKYVAQPAYRAMQSDPTKKYGEIARVLSAQGSQRDAHLQALIDALTRRQSNAAAAPAIGNRTALAAALLGNAYLQNRSHENEMMPHRKMNERPINAPVSNPK